MQTVLFIVPTLRGGGAERVVVTLLRHLSRRDFRLVLAVVDSRKGDYLEDVPKDVEYVDLCSHRVRYAIFRIGKLIWKIKPDVVFSTLGHLNLAIALAIPFMPKNSRFIAREAMNVSVHLSALPMGRFWRLAYQRLYPRFSAVVCQSNYMKRDMVTNFSVSEKNAVVINNPVDVDRVRTLGGSRQEKRPDGSLRLISVGRLVDEKGFDLLIDAIALLGDVDISLIILGEGPRELLLRKRIANAGLCNRIQMGGFSRNPFEYFSRSDAFVLSSRTEGLPNVVIEALAYRLPVIATPAIGGTKEILDGLDGCVIAEEITATSLAAAIRKWIASPQKVITNLATDRFRVEKIVHQYAALFESMSQRNLNSLFATPETFGNQLLSPSSGKKFSHAMEEVNHRAKIYRALFYWSRHNSIFIHVPRVAGTSISRAIYGRTLGHFCAEEIQRRLPGPFERLFVFGFVRNPWDRVLSAYRFAKSGGTEHMRVFRPDQYRIPEFDNFERFLFEWLAIQNVNCLDFVFQEQRRFICDSENRILVDHLGKIEMIDRNIQFIEGRLHRTIPLKKLNYTSDGMGYIKHYRNQDMIELVRTIYGKDIELFDYRFGE